MDRAIGVMTCPYSAIVPWRKACSISPAAAAGGAHQGGTGAGTRRQRAHDHRLSAAAPPSCSVLLASVCNTLDALIDRLIDPPELRPSVHPGRVLSGNFAPTDELPPTRCPVVRGSIPSSLAGGAYVRNGPNPRHRLPGRTHHLFDGDGMLHSLLLPSPPSPTTSPSSLSEPVLCSRYVQTYKYLLERETGTPVFPNFFAGFHGVAGLARAAVMLGRVLAGQIKLNHGFGVANTSVVFFAECLYALCESDIPYSVFISPSTGEVTTLGRCDFDGRLAIAMTAHPKKDPITGELFAFRYSILQPFITYFWFDAAGNKCADVPIFSSEQPSVLHDFAITEHYTIFVESQLVVKPSSGSLVGFDPAKVPRIGVLPRYARDDSEMRWFDVPGFNMLHTTNAWEEAAGDEVVLVAPSHLSLEHMAVGDMELLESRVYMVRVNIRTGAVSRAAVSPESLEYGVVHHGYVGRRSRYGYFGVNGPMPKISGIRKLDFDMAGTGTGTGDDGGDCTIARHDFGPRCFAGEAFFVPSNDGDEDDGYLVCYVHDEGTGESRFVVLDARSPKLDVVAEVQLPGRVPYGFHGMFVTQAELLVQQQ